MSPLDYDREVSSTYGKVGAARRHGRSPEEIRQLEQESAAALLAKRVHEIVSTAPPLSSAQVARITALLSTAA